MAAPISAKSASWRAVAPMLAPRSRTMQLCLIVGHWPAITGRSMPGMVFRISLAMAIRAPVLPAETAQSASPFCTASRASHMLEPRPRRTAWLGLSCISMAMSVCTMRDRSASAGCCCQMRLDPRLVADQQEVHVGMALKRQGGARNDHGRASIAAHGIERYRARPCHGVFALRDLAAGRAESERPDASPAVPPENARP